MLSNKALNRMAEALAPEVAEYIFADERWVEFMMEVVPDAVRDKLGELDVEMMVELSQCIMDKIYLKCDT
jgi:hypothetical protein